jgi:Protein of unknown function (DUF3040)
MPLTRSEQRRLATIETALVSESPELAALLSGRRAPRRGHAAGGLRRLIMLASAFLGLVAAVVGGMLASMALAVVGLILAIACLLDVSAAVWRRHGARPAGSG